LLVVHDLESVTRAEGAAKAAASVIRALHTGPSAGIGVLLSVSDRRELLRDYRIHEIAEIELGRLGDEDDLTPTLGRVARVDRDVNPVGDVVPVRVVAAGVDEAAADAQRTTREATARRLPAPDVVRYLELPGFLAFEDLFTDAGGKISCRWEEPADGLRATLGVTKRSRPLVVTFSERSVDQTSTVHTFLAGTTGAGKTATLQTLMLALAFSYSPRDLRIIVLDMKGGGDFLTLTELPHLVRVSSDPADAHMVLMQLAAEYQRRVDRFRELARPGVPMTNISEYRDAGHWDFPSLLLVIDEPATLRADRELGADSFRVIEDICRRGRAAGIHLVLTTLEPDPSVLTPVIKANVRGRIALQMASATQSAMLLGTDDAIDLRGRGHGIYQLQEDVNTREYFQAAYADMRHWESMKSAIEEAMAAAGEIGRFDLPSPQGPAPAGPTPEGDGLRHLQGAAASLERAEQLFREAGADAPQRGGDQ
jgi:hypothetical protein